MPGNLGKRATSAAATVGWWFIPVVVMSTVWVPVIVHYYFPTPSITTEMVSNGRQVPPDEVLDELRHFYYHELLAYRSPESVISAAESLQQGRLNYPGLPPLKIRMPCEPQELEEVPPEWQLEFAVLGFPNILIKAYEYSGRNEFLSLARDCIVAWASFERQAWLPEGLLWNDHAIAARVLVLSRFWRNYRHSHLYTEDVAKTVFEFAARSGQFLANPAHFTYSTNHGVMQNLGLWHLVLSFPTLPHSSEYGQLALSRLREQMPYYLSGEGVILEHSVGYQEFGLNLLSLAFRYAQHLNAEIDAQWKEKYDKAKQFYALLRRPDGTLPIFGDTSPEPGRIGPPIVEWDEMGRSSRLSFVTNWRPSKSVNLFPSSGYLVQWEGLEHWPNLPELSQTMVAWSYFPGHGHKHADEMSVSVWANGETWLTNHGYWTGAEPWGGSNAPHLRLESRNATRKTELKYYESSDSLALIDLERRGLDNYVARREVIFVKPSVWIIFDQSFYSGTDISTTSWITPSEISWSKTPEPALFELKGVDSRSTMSVSFAGSPGTTFNPPPPNDKFGSGESGAKTGLITEQPANNSWVLSAWVLNGAPHGKFKLGGSPVMSRLTDAENWSIRVPSENGDLHISRDQARLIVDGPGRSAEYPSLTLHAADKVDAKVGEIRRAYEKVSEKYPTRFRDLLLYRMRASTILAFIFIAQELVFLVVPSRWNMRLRALNSLCWLSGGAWLHMAYLV